MPRKGDCGRGVMTGSCSGDACTTETKEKPCKVRCAAKPDAVPEPTDAAVEPADPVEPTETVPEEEQEAVATGGKRGGRGKGGKNKGKKPHRGKPQNKPAPATGKSLRPLFWG